MTNIVYSNQSRNMKECIYINLFDRKSNLISRAACGLNKFTLPHAAGLSKHEYRFKISRFYTTEILRFQNWFCLKYVLFCVASNFQLVKILWLKCSLNGQTNGAYLLLKVIVQGTQVSLVNNRIAKFFRLKIVSLNRGLVSHGPHKIRKIIWIHFSPTLIIHNENDAKLTSWNKFLLNLKYWFSIHRNTAFFEYFLFYPRPCCFRFPTLGSQIFVLK